jgi:hypothetical protein
MLLMSAILSAPANKAKAGGGQPTAQPKNPLAKLDEVKVGTAASEPEKAPEVKAPEPVKPTVNPAAVFKPGAQKTVPAGTAGAPSVAANGTNTQGRGRIAGQIISFKLPLGPLLRAFPYLNELVYESNEREQLTEDEFDTAYQAAKASGEITKARNENRLAEFMEALAERPVEGGQTLATMRDQKGEYYKISLGRGAHKEYLNMLHEKNCERMETMHHAASAGRMTKPENDKTHPDYKPETDPDKDKFEAAERAESEAAKAAGEAEAKKTEEATAAV